MTNILTRPSVPMLKQPRRSKVLALLSASLACFCLFLASGRASAAEYYVSPTGSDSNPGTQASPFATLQKGNNSASAGDTVWLRGGTYNTTGQITLSKSGTSDTSRTKIWAYPGEVPVIDFSNFGLASSGSDNPAITVTGSWMHLKGLEIANGKVGSSGSHSYSMLRTKGASNNTFELLNIHHGFGPGLFIDTGNGGNLIVNCDSHDNYDKDGSQGDGQNADGFGVHYQMSGPSTTIRGCRAWLDSDDGYDLISQEVPVLIENSWAVSNGYSNGGSGTPSSGNGNGFKAGSSETGIRHILQNNVAWKNRAAGFYANHSSGGNTWLNNTSYMNAVQYNMLASPAGDSATTIVLSGALAHKMRNNIGFPNKNTNMSGVDSMFDTWDLSISEASTDFVSTADAGFMGPRQADGSLPDLDFLKLKAGSPLIDKGTNVGLSYVGSAPDLGAYEYGAVSSSGGTGGAGNSAGGNDGSSGAASSTGGASSAGAPASSGGAAGSASGTAGARDAGGGSSVAGAAGGSRSVGTAGQAAGPNGTAGTASASPAGSPGVTDSGAASGCTCNLSSAARRNQRGSLLLLGAAYLLVRGRRRARASKSR